MKLFLLTIIFIGNLFAMGLPSEYYKIKDTKQMKKYFFNYIKTMTDHQNKLILEDRQFVINNYSKKNNTKLKAIQKRYKLKADATLETHLKYIDIVPTSIVLAQAALESGWGKSRFVKKANNIFGQWTWSGKGLIPSNRNKGAKHKIRIFDSMEQSVRGYLINLNIGHAYDAFRVKRQLLRKTNKKLIGRSLSDTLINYSQLREEYTKRLSNMIRREKLERFD